MASRIRFFNHFGEYEDLVEDIPTTPRSWVLNKYGRCEFSLPLDHPFVHPRYLQFGNFIHIQHVPTIGADEGGSPGGKLPDWTGVILPPRTWDDGSVHIVAYSAEAILAYRAMPYISLNATPGDCFRAIIENVNYPAQAGRAPGTNIFFKLGVVDNTVLESGVMYTDDLRTNAYDHINKMVDTVKMEWDVTGRIVPESNALELTANLRRRVIDPATLSLTTASALSLTTANTEMANPLLTEQGTILNRIFAYSQSYTEADRVMQDVRLDPSISDYGEFQINAVYLGQHDATGVYDAARMRTSGGSGRPSKLFKRVALDVLDTFTHLRVGNLVMVDEPRVGFNPNGGLGFRSLVRIVSMDYNDTTNKVNLNVEVVL